ncbi:MAG: alpha/beta hydrolase [Candidatus Saccharibacteria bacterium]
MNIIVNDLLTQYTLTGTGKLVLLLHGWGDSSGGLAAVDNQLSQDYRVLALDLPGFGGTQPPRETWGLDDYASFVEAVLQKLNLGQLYAVIGHSNGGAIAIRGCARHMLRPRKLILLAAAGVRNKHSARRLVLNVIAKLGKVATWWLPRRSRQALRARLYGAAGSDLLVVAGLQATFKKTVRQDVQADAATLKLPTLLIYGAHDRAVPLADGQRYHSLIENSRLEIIKDAGHFVHLDQPAQVQRLIAQFLGL